MIFTLHPKERGIQCHIDECDADLAMLSWRPNFARKSNHPYVLRFWRIGGGKKASEYLHRAIAARMGFSLEGMIVDHINGDTLDNRRSNLRVVTPSESVRNTAGAYSTTKHGTPGVHFTPQGTWQAGIGVNGKWVYLGRHKTKQDAITARLNAEKRLWGIQPRRAWEHHDTTSKA